MSTAPRTTKRSNQRTTRRRRCTAALALTSLAWGQGCVSYQRPPAGPITAGSRVRVLSTPAGPVASAATSPALPALSYRVPGGAVCQATAVEGVLAFARRDTLAFERLTRVRAAAGGDEACAKRNQLALLARPDDAQLTVERFSWGRTTVLVLGVTAVAVGVLAYIASNMEFDGWGSSTGGSAGF